MTRLRWINYHRSAARVPGTAGTNAPHDAVPVTQGSAGSAHANTRANDDDNTQRFLSAGALVGWPNGMFAGIRRLCANVSAQEEAESVYYSEIF